MDTQDTSVGYETLNRIAENAQSLLSDAELLYNSGRYARALSLSILAIEEAGKFFLIKWKTESNRANARYHASKQHVIATFAIADAAVSKFQGLAAEIGLQLKHVSEANPAQLAWLESDEGKAVHEYFFRGEEVLTAVTSAVQTVSQNGIVKDIRDGRLQIDRNRGLYVDLSSKGEVVSTPNSVTAEEAQRYIEYARSAVHHVRSRADTAAVQIVASQERTEP